MLPVLTTLACRLVLSTRKRRFLRVHRERNAFSPFEVFCELTSAIGSGGVLCRHFPFLRKPNEESFIVGGIRLVKITKMRIAILRTFENNLHTDVSIVFSIEDVSYSPVTLADASVFHCPVDPEPLTTVFLARPEPRTPRLADDFDRVEADVLLTVYAAERQKLTRRCVSKERKEGRALFTCTECARRRSSCWTPPGGAAASSFLPGASGGSAPLCRDDTRVPPAESSRRCC